MGKYEPLGVFLGSLQESRRPVSFQELESILGARLPPSARYSAWWSNNPSNNRMTQVWLDAGWRTAQVDIPGQKLVFERAAPARAPSPVETVPPDVSKTGLSKGELWWNRVYGAMKHTMHIPEGVDLTQPTGERWKAQED